jgi:hypothetical protein
MGYYIQVPAPHDKALQLRDLHGAEILPGQPRSFQDVPDDKALICVVQNSMFDAAALCYSEEEFEEFKDISHDPRPRTWVLVDRELAYELAGFKG